MSCINWTGYRDRDGYGRVSHCGRSGRLAHRIAWEKTHGAIPRGMTVDHICFNRGCLNVSHMRLLSHVENASRQRSALSNYCKHGHKFTTKNTYWRPTGQRQCRICNKEAVRRYSVRKAA